jgi:acyl-CoA thioester hydrolase
MAALEDGVFRYRIIVPTEAIDIVGHANNTAYVGWMQDAAIMHSTHVGLDWDAYVKLGAAFVIRRHEIDYLRAVRAGDAVEIATWIATMHQTSSERKTEMKNADGEPILRASTTWIFVSLKTGKPTRIPDDVRDRFARKA